jgi:N-acetylneuraminic acid mutarotase
MIVFGGYMVDRYSNRVFSYDFKNNTWEEQETDEIRPTERASMGMSAYKNSFFIFGGTNGVKKFDDLW